MMPQFEIAFMKMPDPENTSILLQGYCLMQVKVGRSWLGVEEDEGLRVKSRC